MSTLRSTRMNNGSPQRIPVFLFIKIAFATQVLGCIFLHVDFEREVEIAVDFDLLHLVVVEFKSFEDYDEDVRKLFDAKPLLCSYFLLTDLTEVRVIAVKYLSFDETFKRFF